MALDKHASLELQRTIAKAKAYRDFRTIEVTYFKGIFLNYVMVLGWVGTFEIAILAFLGVGSVRFLGFTVDFQ